MRTVIVRSYKTIKGIVVLICKPNFELVALCMKPVGKYCSDFINLRIRHLYGFHIPHLYIFAIYLYRFRNIRCSINKGMFKQSNSVIGTTLRFNRIFIPYMNIFVLTGYRKIIGAVGVMNMYFCIEKM